MDISNLTIGLGITGSFCSFEKTKLVTAELVEKAKKVIPVYSYNSQMLNTRFMMAKDFVAKITELTGENGLKTLQDAE